MKSTTKRHAETAQRSKPDALGALDVELEVDDDYPADIAELLVGMDLVVASLRLARLVPARVTTAAALAELGSKLIEAHSARLGARSRRRRVVRASARRRRGARG